MGNQPRMRRGAGDSVDSVDSGDLGERRLQNLHQQPTIQATSNIVPPTV